MSNLRSYNRRGFTLTELAIVLGVIGTIISAIWVAASAVHQKNQTTRAATEIGYIVSHMQSIAAINIANLYVAQDGGCSGGVAQIKGNSLSSNTTAGVFPQEMISGTASTPIISSPWGQDDVGLVVNAQSNSCVLNGNNSNPGNPGYQSASLTYAGSFALTYLSMPASACELLVLSKGIGFANLGLSQICIGSSGSNGCAQSLSVTPATAAGTLTETAVNAACTLGGTVSSSTPVSVQFTFSMTTPS